MNISNLQGVLSLSRANILTQVHLYAGVHVLYMAGLFQICLIMVKHVFPLFIAMIACASKSPTVELKER